MRPATGIPLPLLAILGLALFATLGMDAQPATVTTPVPPAVQAPAFIRVDVPAGEERRVPLDAVLAQDATLLAAEVDCRCVSLVETTPLALPAGRNRLTLRVVGLLPGVKTVTLRTTAGSVAIQVQVAVPGADDGLAVLKGIAAEARRDGLGITLIVHDLRGNLLNCGCTTGSLGGIDHLIGLPAVVRGLGIARVRCVLTGDSAGTVAGLDPAFAERGWEVRPADIVLTADPVAALGAAGVTAIIPLGNGPAPAHQRIVRPVLDSGATAIALLIDDAGNIRAQHVVPIDRSLPADAEFTARFTPTRGIVVKPATAATAHACAACHPAAQQAWTASAHARAFASLAPSQQVDGCVTCHSSPAAEPAVRERSEHVTCIACHQGATAHAAAPTTVRTAGTVDCRSCHDGIHHPTFDPVAAWQRIGHGR